MRFKGRAHSQRVDVADWASVSAMADVAEARFGHIDILVNSAGIGSFATTPDLEPEAWDRVLAVDLKGVFLGCKAVIPRIRARGSGAIVNVASISGMAGDYGFAAYNAAKAGVINYTRGSHRSCPRGDKGERRKPRPGGYAHPCRDGRHAGRAQPLGGAGAHGSIRPAGGDCRRDRLPGIR